ncbi:hypothetical protein K8I31_09040, partial [bacterium]|nr:hypothetical protein [bacterium]
GNQTPLLLSIKSSDASFLQDALQHRVNGFLRTSFKPNALLQSVHRCIDLKAILYSKQLEEIFAPLQKEATAQNGESILAANTPLTPDLALGLYDLHEIFGDSVHLPKLPFGNKIDFEVQ